MKKEYLSPRAKEYSEKSDTELIDLIATEPSAIIQETAKAILDKRTKIVLQDLTEAVKKNNRTTKWHNWIMIFLTVALIVVAGFQTFIFLQNRKQAEKEDEQEFIFSMKQKCQEEGEKLYQKKEQEAGENTIIFTPEYTYNKESNSCLYSGGSTNHITKINERFVIDIFKNTEILAIRMLDNEIIPDCYACVSSWEEFWEKEKELFNK